MSDRSNKEQPASQSAKKNPAKSPTNNQWLIVGGVAAALTLYGLYYANSGEEHDIAAMTRPAFGFEVIESSENAEEEPTLLAVDENHLNFADADTQDEEQEEPDEITPLRIRVHELEQLNQEKDGLIIELTQRLADKAARPVAAVLKDTPPTSAKHRTHTVKKGETLSEIARQYYGSGSRWKEIYDANAENLNDKNRVRVGTVLIIPE